MKKLVAALFLLLVSSSPVYAKDSCTTVLCMAGMLQGVGVVDGCNGAVKDYFSIIKLNGHGGISLNKTFKARGKFLKKCSSNSGWAKKINKKYGRLL